MIKRLSILLLTLSSIVFAGWAVKKESSYKCLIQLTNYQGEGAYLAISLIDPDGNYEETLYVMGEDPEWYPDMEKWWSYFDPSGEQLDGLSGATIGGGERQICLIELDDQKLDAGYSLRFETAVEDQKYYAKDVEIPLTSENVKGKFDGTGYIRYIRIIPN